MNRRIRLRSSTNYIFVFLLLAVSVPVRAVAVTFDEATKALEGLSSSERTARLEKEALKEGKVRWATSANLDRVRPVVEAFKKRYPGIVVEYNRLSGRALAERTIREYRGGVYEVDVLDFASIPFLSVKEAGVIRPYFSPQSAGVKAGMKDEKGFWIAHFSNVFAILCNKSRVQSVPRDWRDFSQPKWKGDFSIDVERFEWFHALSRTYGADEAKQLIGGYLQNGALIKRGATLQAQLVAAGEYSCVLAIYLDSINLLLKDGAPIVFSVPEPSLISPSIIMMTRLPPHPYAAMLLYDYVISQEGQSHFTRSNAVVPSRDDVTVVEAVKRIQGRPMHFIAVEDISQNYKESSQLYQSLLRK
jgi:iron(III) transport system substrate-binding protein